MGDLDLQYPLKVDGLGVLSAFWKILTAKATGVLSLEWEKFKKQIVFRKGEPTSVRSNVPDESFAAFALRQKIVDRTTLKGHLERKEKAKDSSPLAEWFAKEGLLAFDMLPVIHQTYFRERLFSSLSLSVGSLQFKQVSDGYVFDGESQSLTEPFWKLLWETSQSFYSDKIVRAKLAERMATFPSVEENFPIPLKGPDLRLWNQILSGGKRVRDLDLASMRLLVVADLMEKVTWRETEAIPLPATSVNLEQLMSEMTALEVKFQKARAHEVLGVDFDASVEVCQKAYYDMIRKYHPDRLSSEASPEQKKMSERIFSKINTAFSLLTDPEKRAEYQAQIELENAGGVEAIQRRVEAEFMIPHAQAALKRRQFKLALERLVKIEEVLVDDAEVMADRVYAEFMTMIEDGVPVAGRTAEFLGLLKRALELKKTYAPARYYRGVLLKQSGQMDQAAAEFQAAVDLDPKLSEAASELRLIQSRSQKKK